MTAVKPDNAKTMTSMRRARLAEYTVRHVSGKASCGFTFL